MRRLRAREITDLSDVKNSEEHGSSQVTDQRSRGTAKSREKDNRLNRVSDGQ